MYYVIIIVNDAGELKTISASELVQGGFDFTDCTVTAAIDAILYARSAAEELEKERRRLAKVL